MEGRLVTAPIAGETAMVLMLQPAAPAPQAPQIATDAAELAALLDIAVDGVVTLDSDATIVTANARADRLFGYDAGALVGKQFGDLFAPESERIAKSRLDRLAVAMRPPTTTAARSSDAAARAVSISLQLTLGRANSAARAFTPCSAT